MWNCNNPYGARNAELAALGFSSYHEYLQSNLWRGIRERAMKRAKRRCERCGSMRRLQVHHRAYDRATLAGDNIDSLTVACRVCHASAEQPWRQRNPNDRLSASSEFLATTRPDYNERVNAWFSKHYAALAPKYTSPDVALNTFRRRATTAGASRCIWCGKKIRETEPKRVNQYLFCAFHSWVRIRAVADGLALSI